MDRFLRYAAVSSSVGIDDLRGAARVVVDAGVVESFAVVSSVFVARVVPEVKELPVAVLVVFPKRDVAGLAASVAVEEAPPKRGVLDLGFAASVVVVVLEVPPKRGVFGLGLVASVAVDAPPKRGTLDLGLEASVEGSEGLAPNRPVLVFLADEGSSGFESFSEVAEGAPKLKVFPSGLEPKEGRAEDDSSTFLLKRPPERPEEADLDSVLAPPKRPLEGVAAVAPVDLSSGLVLNENEGFPSAGFPKRPVEVVAAGLSSVLAPKLKVEVDWVLLIVEAEGAEKVVEGAAEVVVEFNENDGTASFFSVALAPNIGLVVDPNRGLDSEPVVVAASDGREVVVVVVPNGVVEPVEAGVEVPPKEKGLAPAVELDPNKEGLLSPDPAVAAPNEGAGCVEAAPNKDLGASALAVEFIENVLEVVVVLEEPNNPPDVVVAGGFAPNVPNEGAAEVVPPKEKPLVAGLLSVDVAVEPKGLGLEAEVLLVEPKPPKVLVPDVPEPAVEPNEKAGLVAPSAAGAAVEPNAIPEEAGLAPNENEDVEFEAPKPVDPNRDPEGFPAGVVELAPPKRDLGVAKIESV